MKGVGQTCTCLMFPCRYSQSKFKRCFSCPVNLISTSEPKGSTLLKQQAYMKETAPVPSDTIHLYFAGQKYRVATDAQGK